MLSTLQPGDAVVLEIDCYYEFRHIISQYCQRLGVTLMLADLCDQEAINYAAFSARPRLIWVETPTNPAWKIPDIAAIARQAGATLTVDATVATPLLRNCAGKPGYSAIPPR